MLRKSLFAIAILALVATCVQAADPFDPDSGKAIKIDGDWPSEIIIIYEDIEICQVPVYLKVGYYVEVENCDKEKIVMEQVSCSLIGKNPSKDFPCYLGCTDLKVRANFEAKLGTNIYKVGDVIDGDKIDAYYTDADGNPSPAAGADIVPGDGNWKTTYLCVKAWNADIFKVPASPGDETKVAEIGITVKPNA